MAKLTSITDKFAGRAAILGGAALAAGGITQIVHSQRGSGSQVVGVAGYLTLSISNELLPQILEVKGVSLGVNYGVDRIRFPAPVPVGSRLRAGAELVDVTDVKGGIQTLVRITLEIEGGTKPVCIIDSLSRYLA